KLIVAGIAVSVSLQVKFVRDDPAWHGGQQKLQLAARELIGEIDVGDQRNVGAGKQAAGWGGCITGKQGNVHIGKFVAGLVGFDGNELERGDGRSGGRALRVRFDRALHVVDDEN